MSRLLCAHEAKGLRRHHQCHRHAAQTHDPEYICGVAGNAALTAFSQSLGSVNVRDSVRVISLNPGPVETERLVNLMKKKAKDRTGNADNCRALFKPLPFGRACAPDEVGAMIAFPGLRPVQLQQRFGRHHRRRSLGANL